MVHKLQMPTLQFFFLTIHSRSNQDFSTDISDQVPSSGSEPGIQIFVQLTQV